MIGHSRLGKTAVWAGASDPRFALVISGNSGCCGVAISRRCFGETVEAMNVRFFLIGSVVITNNLMTGKNTYLSTSTNLLPLIAPRPIYIASAEEDNWSDQKVNF